MNITFRDKKFSKLVNDYRKLRAAKGAKQAKKITQRLGDLRAADTLEDTRHLPGKFHELRNERKGQWACSLDGPYRMIFEPHEDPIPEDDNGSYIWSEIRGVEIVEIVNYHKEG